VAQSPSQKSVEQLFRLCHHDVLGCFRAIAATVCAVAVLGCGKTDGPKSHSDDATGGDGGAGTGVPAGTSGSSGAPQAGGASGGFGNGGRGGAASVAGSDAGGESACEPTAPPDAPVRRLRRFEYENSLRELFGEQSWSATALPVDPYGDATAPPSLALVEAQHLLARDLAFRATESEAATSEFIGCDAVADGTEECRDRFIGDFVERAFRRPPTSSELEQFTSSFDEAANEGFPLGVRAVIQVALQSPEFLYLPEFGVEAPERGDGWARPTAYEMASRISYLLWGSPPDAELLDAARDEALRSPEELEAQARRLLADPRASKAIGNFYVRLLELDGATFPAVGLEQYPTFTADVAAQLLGETEAFVADVTLVSKGDLRTLLTAPYTFVNEPLAAFYEIAGVSGNEFQRVDVAPGRRGGLLTHASFLAATAQGPFTNPSERGYRITGALLCPKPPRHPVESAPPGPLPPNMTTRQRFAQHALEPTCARCHSLVDALGFAFEHYDAAGLYRDTENGLPIDATGTTDVTGDFDGALELVERLADSENVRRCFVENWYVRALGHGVTAADACYVSALDRDFVGAATNLEELLIALVKNDAFLYRPEVAP
jgi:hypothetical protein